jgi:hypothetical protein
MGRIIRKTTMTEERKETKASARAGISGIIVREQIRRERRGT